MLWKLLSVVYILYIYTYIYIIFSCYGNFTVNTVKCNRYYILLLSKDSNEDTSKWFQRNRYPRFKKGHSL